MAEVGPPPLLWEDPSRWQSFKVDNPPLGQSIPTEAPAASASSEMLNQIMSRSLAGGGLPQSVLNGTLASAPAQDFRIRLSALHDNDVYGKDSSTGSSGIMQPLQATGGLLFPYTPTIGFSQAVNYMDLQLVHSNTDYAAYTRTPSVSVSITAKFTVQSQTEGRYALAALHFLRAASKCYFGVSDKEKAGLPPPVLVLNGYGNYVFNHLRVVLKNHSWTFDDSADGVVISVANGGTARLPALFTITCELVVIQTPQRMRNTFSFDAFASGSLMQGNNVGWI